MTDRFKSSQDVIVRTEKLSIARRFYEKVLGFPVTQVREDLLRFDTGAIRLYVESGKDHGPVFDFLVPDVQAAKQRLLSEGCVLVEEDPGLPRCYVRDPFGVVFNIGKSSG